jgi:hypothetical protein
MADLERLQKSLRPKAPDGGQGSAQPKVDPTTGQDREPLPPADDD